MCEGEHGGGTIVCQHGFHFLAENPVQPMQFHSSSGGSLFFVVCYEAFSVAFNVSINVLLGGGDGIKLSYSN